MDHDLKNTQRFQERSIKTWIDEMQAIFNDLHEETMDVDLSEEQEEEIKQIRFYKKERFEYLANRVYNISVAYFESKHLSSYVARFEEKIKPFLSSRKLLLSAKEVYDFPTSNFVREFEQFLNPFPEFGSGEDISALSILEHILESTATILNDKKIIPKKETDISNAVRIVCASAFPNANFPTQSFITTAKHYIPDVLIPSLKCAVEYKYAPSEKKLIKTIEEILIDVKGYQNNPSYNLFYAAFYVKSAHTTKVKFGEIWKEFGFPENWKPIYVFGN